MKVEKKISIKTAFGAIPAIRKAADSGAEYDEKGELKGKPKPVHIVRVMGIGHTVKTGESDNGPWTAIIGEAKAINVQTGEEIRSGKVFLPSPADEITAGQLAAEGVNSVQYAWDISVIAAPDSAVGYEYVVESVMEPGENDPLAALEADMPKLPALAAPKSGGEETKTNKKR